MSNKNIEKLNILNSSEKRKYQELIKVEIKNLFKFAKKSKFIENVKFEEFNYSKPDYISKIKDANDLTKKKNILKISSFNRKDINGKI